jgi:3-hydroxybutyryl-CoA dehydrogenase
VSDEGAQTSSVRTVGVVGAGVMGAGVAQNLAQSGHEVIVVDINPEALERARQDIRNGVRGMALFGQKSGPGADLQAVLARVHFTTEEQQLSGADFVIENVTEKWTIKEPIYRRLDKLCRPDVIVAANTSAIPITRIASATQRAKRVIGIHFMNPVPQKPMVEVIRGYHTSDDTVEQTRSFLRSMGKDCVVVNDSPGFVSNRVLMLTINEAIYLLHEQVSTPADIDKIFKTCFGHKMGPLETADLIGLDTILLSIEVLHTSFGDDKYRPCPLLSKMVDAGLHGRKSGQGFYAY